MLNGTGKRGIRLTGVLDREVARQCQAALWNGYPRTHVPKSIEIVVNGNVWRRQDAMRRHKVLVARRVKAQHGEHVRGIVALEADFIPGTDQHSDSPGANVATGISSGPRSSTWMSTEMDMSRKLPGNPLHVPEIGTA